MVVPQEVPLGPREFVNREADLARMDAFWGAWSAGMAQVGVCTGLPGVGKTAFVRRCVQRVREARAFPGGDLHVEFGPVGGPGLSVADALASCLGALGVAKDVLPATLPERANRLRSITAGRPVLIVLEDVTDPAQVLPFVPNGPDSVVLVTSSSQLSELLADGAEAIRLEPLGEEAGAHLLTTLVGARAKEEPAAVADLVRHCGGLPVALKVAAARLLARPAMRVEALVSQVEAGSAAFSLGGKDKVAAVFAVAYDALDGEPARLYRLLGLFPGRDLTLNTLAALADVPEERVSPAVDALIEAGLLNEDPAQRFSLHAMVRRHAEGLARAAGSPDDGEAAVKRVVRHLLRTAAFADRAVLGPGRYRVDAAAVAGRGSSPFTGADAKREAVRWLDRERANLLAVQRAAAELELHDESWRLAEALSALYVTRRYLVDWTESSQLGAGSAAAAGNHRAEARLRSFASRAWTDLGDLDRAREELVDQALPLAEAAGDQRLLASVWEMLGRYRDAAAADNAVEAYQRAIALFAQEDDARGVAFTSFFLGCSHHGSRRLEQAEEILRSALPQIREVGDARMEGRCLTELGDVLGKNGQPVEARRLIGDAITVLRRAGHPYYEAAAQERLLPLIGDNRDARRACLRRLVELHLSLGSARADEFKRLLEED